jgi:undecaprenyl diphosphate synthase
MREVKPMNVPAHLAIIMDGNGRWAKKRSMPRFMGHAEGAKSVRVITEECARLGIKYLTLYAFSTENWKRPEKEVSFLMGLLGRYLDSETETLLKNNVRLFTIGDISKLPAKVSRKLESVKEKTSKNSGLKLVLALNYGSKNEILSAVKKIAEKAGIHSRSGPYDKDERRIQDIKFSALAAGIYGALYNKCAVARFQEKGTFVGNKVLQ